MICYKRSGVRPGKNGDGNPQPSWLWNSVVNPEMAGIYECSSPRYGVHQGIDYKMVHQIWLVVSTLLKNVSQLGLLFPIYGKS